MAETLNRETLTREALGREIMMGVSVRSKSAGTVPENCTQDKPIGLLLPRMDSNHQPPD